MADEEILRRLRLIHFTATAFDLEAGDIDAVEVAFRLRRDAPNRTDREECLALAAEIGEPTSGTPRTCIGFGEFDGKCDQPAGSSHSELWCQRCDDLRLAALTRQFAEIGAHFGVGGGLDAEAEQS